MPAIARTLLKTLASPVKEAVDKCTPLEQRFVVEYCGGPFKGNQTMALQRARGPRAKPQKYNTTAAQASTMMLEGRVRAAIEAWMQAYAMSAAEVTARLADMARISPEPFTHRDPATGLLTCKVPDAEVWAAHAHWIKGMEVDPKTGAVTRLHLHDSMRALEIMAKILKLFSDTPQVVLNLYLAQMSDDELLRQIEDGRQSLASRGMAAASPN